MKILFINSVCGITSTGKICTELADKLTSEGHECKIGYGRLEYVPEKYKHYAIKIGNKLDVLAHVIASRIFDCHGFCSRKATQRFLEWADEFNPDVLWLHNLHGYYINIELLFNWIKKRPQMKVKWTLHDCWAFTGHCTHFSFAKCNKWKLHCNNCELKKAYPKSCFLDCSYSNFEKKKELFSGIQNLLLITPSLWLANLVHESYLSVYPIEVQKNTIDLNIFHKTQGDFRKQYGLENKFIILGVANGFGKMKGIDDFISLSKLINDKTRIVLVGIKNKNELKKLPNNILGLIRTNNQKELAQIYSCADIFFNPTYEDNYPTVNLEAQACGLQVISYDVGGCSETLSLKDSMVIPVGEYWRLVDLFPLIRK